MIENPRFKRSFRPAEPPKGRSGYRKGRGVTPRGYSIPVSRGESRNWVTLVYSWAALLMSISFVVCLLIGALLTDLVDDETIGLIGLGCFVGVHFVFVLAEVGLGRELKFRKVAMGLLWGTIVAALLLGICSAALSR